MQFSGKIHDFSPTVKTFLLLFVIALSFGFLMGYTFLNRTTGFTPQGIEENYNGNDPDVGESFVFKKSEKEILTVIHTHVLSMSLIFLALGGILLLTSVNDRLKKFLLIEPFISIILTFGGIWLLWKEVLWFKYIIMISGILMVLSFILMVLLIVWQILFVKKKA